MSKSDVVASSAEQDEAAPDSVFDFLYHDSRRIGSFLSQFDNSGYLTGLTQGETAGLKTRRGWKASVGADLPLLAGAKVEIGTEPSAVGSETMERSYDPFWANALALLDYLTERNLIQLQIDEANLGQFVLVRGSLSVLDFSLWKDAWQLDTIQRAVRAGAAAGQQAGEQPLPGNRHDRRLQSKHKKPARDEMPNDADLTLELMQVLPHMVNATITTDLNDRVWSVLRQEFLVTPSAELVLSHGSGIPGEWSMLGILSGQPDFGETEMQTQLAEMASALPPGLVNSGLGATIAIISPIIRTTMGRPANSYGVTPLLIFRETN